MTCVGCGLDLAAEFAFCPRCGRRQPVACASCGHACEPDFAFCPKCGAPVKVAALAATPNAPLESRPLSGRAPSDADRRQVTVLFADLCGFTSLSERLDPEEVRAFQGELFDALGQSIGHFGGFVAKYLGDAVMALFGAPVAHEDDPLRALHAARDMLVRAKALGAKWEARLGQPVALHVAVDTGPVVAGNLGGGSGAAYDVTGDTVNTASRLLGVAAPGTVLVTHSTHVLARHHVDFEPAGDVALRGKAEPMAVHRLLGVLADPQSARGLAALGLATPFVGRTVELGALLAAFERTVAGQACIASITGEAGIGKTRLMAEFLSHLESGGRLAGTTVRRVACSSLGEPAYGLFAALFREGYGVSAGDSLATARHKLAEGLAALGAESEIAQAMAPVLSWVLGLEADEGRDGGRDVDPEQLKRQILLAGRTLIERRLEQGPLLIIVDDFHWADAASIELLRDIADDCLDRPLMILLLHRRDARLLAGRVPGQAITLGPLSKAETAALLDGLLGPSQDPDLLQMRDLIAGRSGGNPLFAEEMVRSLVTAGALVRQGAGWTWTRSLQSLDIPATLQALLMSRVDRLATGTRRALQAAAVLGMTFDQSLLRAIAPEAEKAIGQLVEADLVHDAGNGRYRFAQTLVREAAYENLLLSRRSELHERAARALEQAAGPLPSRLSDLEALGHHWSFTSDTPRAARYLAAAGDHARAVYANDDAIRHYQRALGALESCADCGEESRLVRERLADLQALTGRQSEALSLYDGVRAEWEGAGDAAGTARLYRKIGGIYWEAGERERAKACFNQGIEWLGDHDHPVERAQLNQEMGRLAFRAGDNANAIAWAERALAEVAKARGTGQRQDRVMTEVQAYNTLGVALARTGQAQEAVTRIEESIRLAESHDLLQATCRGYTNLSVLYSSLDPRRGIETCLRGLEIAKKVGDLAFQSRLYANLAVAYCALTDRCEAQGIDAAEKAIALDRRLGLIDHLAVPLIVLGQIRQCHGDPAPARACYEEALALAEQVGEPQLLFPCYDGLATLYLDNGDAAKAELYLAKAQEVCERAGVEPDALMVLPFLC